MGSVSKQGLLTAYRRLLKPLVRILIRNGVTYGEFSEAAKLAYIDSAKASLQPESNKDIKQVSSITGLTESEILATELKANTESEELDSKLEEMVRILHGWHTDADYTGPYGIPLELHTNGQNAKLSFENLVQKYGNGVSSTEALKHLLELNALKETEKGWFKVLMRSYQSTGDSPENLAALTESIQNYINVLDHNISETNPRKRFFERHVYTDNGIKPQDIPRFKAFFEGRAQHLLEEIDNWVANLPATPEGSNIVLKKTGLCIYHYIEEEGSTDDK